MSIGERARWRGQPFVDEGKVVARQDDVLGVLDQPIVLGVEHVVYGGQADVLVDATVTGDEVGVEQLVVVFGIAVAGICQADGDVTVGDLADRNGIVGDVGKEGTVGADGAGCDVPRSPSRGSIGAAEIAFRRRCRPPCWECRRHQRR